MFRYLSIFLFLINFSCKTQRSSDSITENYGTDNIEAKMEFSGYFYAPLRNEKNSDKEDAELLSARARTTLEYMFGAFQWHTEFDGKRGIPFGNPSWEILSSSEQVEYAGKPMRKITYHFSDRVLFNKSTFQAGTTETELKIRLPLDIDSFYELGLVKSQANGKDLVPCTADPKYNTKGDFWYFWKPDNADCPSKLITEGTSTVTASLIPIPNTTRTYPEYGRLGTKSDLKIYAAFGTNGSYTPIEPGSMKNIKLTTEQEQKLREEEKANKDKAKPEDANQDELTAAQLKEFEDDANIKGFLSFKEKFKNVPGFKVSDTSLRKAVITGQVDGRSITIYAQVHKTSTREKKTKLRFDFENFMREALAEGDIILYSGHSGLGGSLPPKRFANTSGETIFNKRYQIMFFNGCSSYAYYRVPYFTQKPGGSKNLDVISTGLESYANLAHEVSYDIVYFLMNRQMSWQYIVDSLYEAGQRRRYLSAHYSVSGDEDNPTTLSEALRVKDNF